jgi:AhpD family alkylhydroperoxidase
MDKLTTRESELVAIGASLASNCIPCVTYHIGMARKCGLSEGQIAAAIELADKVRQTPARAVLDAARRSSPEQLASAPCGCAEVSGSSAP